MTAAETQAAVNEQYRRDAIAGCFNRIQAILYKAAHAKDAGTAAQYRHEADRIIKTELKPLTTREESAGV